jgi:hypothetical protein
MNKDFLLINKYVINTEKLQRLSKENPEYYKFIIGLVEKYLDILHNMNIASSTPLNYPFECRNVIENTLLMANILVTVRQSKIEKILNSK